MIRSLFVFSYCALALIFVLPFLILWSAITKSPGPVYWPSMKAMHLLLRLVGIRVRTEGLENIPPRVCIFAANHVSTLDPMACVPVIPQRVAMLVKKELFRVPLLSAGMRAAQFVPVERRNRESAAASIDVAIQRLKDGVSFAVYPEGTRSPDGRLRPFKKGTFVMAIAAGVPVVPVSIVGTQRLMPKSGLKIRGGDVIVRFGPAVDASQYTPERRGELLARVHALVAEGLPEEQRPLPRPA